MSSGGVIPFFDNVIKQKLLKKNVFSFYLSDAAPPASSLLAKDDGDEVERVKGTNAILWGGIDERLYEGELLWFPVTQAHYWAIDLHEFRVGDEAVPVTSDSSWPFDSMSQ